MLFFSLGIPSSALDAVRSPTPPPAPVPPPPPAARKKNRRMAKNLKTAISKLKNVQGELHLSKLLTSPNTPDVYHVDNDPSDCLVVRVRHICDVHRFQMHKVRIERGTEYLFLFHCLSLSLSRSCEFPVSLKVDFFFKLITVRQIVWWFECGIFVMSIDFKCIR